MSESNIDSLYEDVINRMQSISLEITEQKPTNQDYDSWQTLLKEKEDLFRELMETKAQLEVMRIELMKVIICLIRKKFMNFVV